MKFWQFIDFVIFQHINNIPISYNFDILNHSKQNNPIHSVEDVVFNYISNNGPRINFKLTRPKYIYEPDLVLIPDISFFNSSEEYYYILFHELSHSTIHKTRLDRSIGITDPAFEEIVAEFSTAFILLELGLPIYFQSSSFIRKNSEICLMGDVVENIIKGSNIAISVCDYVLNRRTFQNSELEKINARL